ncbi:Glycosyltransferase, catalytic subunit of cellulose synthase and poly-beta-1,6-N-acetylglucosamine synthase [Cyclobacterium xiamenense]|uniref:Glycosyltransferase, catalytic subunit of cellulose synthase and poly-beta-1,6-N-acetylglucosamine synthase n=1 Tax=Cyclobacterium xiamenense TaxID=1297121 RepID=A0A1H6Z4J3_9BACT|nr:glycosyltransferase [Cyclobacterium xiamenense]SEJ46894.1 Glycosyltransferase, catalytic subunit of cellulose synthase and poly-beta-1,6-N-acetylglucosamine synthase [Cyclobacterium xiamenense]
MRFSVIVPVYNRPAEIRELLESLYRQTYTDFEVLIVEDGSSLTCADVVADYREKLDLRYHFQANTGQGFARNKGMELAEGDYFVFFDSDCILPPGYMDALEQAIQTRGLQAHGGPDDADDTFSAWQKAMNFSLTSFWTTGGIRGKMKNPAKYQARGYNMGFSREIYERLGGFVHANMAEDIEMSLRIKKAGFRLELVEKALVYHRRKNTLKSFLRQSFQFGRNRVFIRRFHPEAVKAVHLLPVFFLLGLLFLPVLALIAPQAALVMVLGILAWTLLVFFSAFENLRVASYAVLTSYGQLLGYGMGILREFLCPDTEDK